MQLNEQQFEAEMNARLANMIGGLTITNTALTVRVEQLTRELNTALDKLAKFAEGEGNDTTPARTA